jgi:hypothetical protein
MSSEKRMAGDYEIIDAVYIGENKVVVGENLKESNGQKYMVLPTAGRMNCLPSMMRFWSVTIIRKS